MSQQNIDVNVIIKKLQDRLSAEILNNVVLESRLEQVEESTDTDL